MYLHTNQTPDIQWISQHNNQRLAVQTATKNYAGRFISSRAVTFHP